MTKHYKQCLEKGSYICDMHNGIPDDIAVINHLRIPNNNAYEVVKEILNDDTQMVSNKIAYVIDVNHLYGTGETVIKAIYSMNDTVFGIFEFVDKTKKPWE